MKISFALILSLLWVQDALSGQSVALKLNLQPEESYIYTMEISQTRNQTVNDETQSLKQDMYEAWQVRVTDKQKSGDIDLTLTHKRIKIDQNFANQVINYDSDNPPEVLDPSMRSLAVMPGTILTARMTPKGQVAKIDGVDAMLDKMIKAMELPDTVSKERVISDLRKQWGTDAMRQALEQITAFYPNKPVSEGDSWKNEIDVPSGGLPMHIASTYNLRKRADARDTIDVSARISSDSASSVVRMGELRMTYNITGSQNGVIVADETTGLPTHSRLDMHYEGTITVSGVPDQEPQSWPISADGSVTITFVRQ